MANSATTDARRTTAPGFDAAIDELASGAKQIRSMPLGKQRELVDACVAGVARNATAWVEAACRAKQIPLHTSLASEEILAGPTSLLRYLRLLSRSLREIEANGAADSSRRTSEERSGSYLYPRTAHRQPLRQRDLSGIGGGSLVVTRRPRPIAVCRSICLEQQPITKHLRSSRCRKCQRIPATDTLYKIFNDGEAVLLKLNPVNDYLESPFNDAFRPLIDANLLRIVRGGHEAGEAIVKHPRIDTLHITGSHLTHDAIVWGSDADERVRRQQSGKPLVTKPITSELGNVTPWIVVPGRYTKRQLRAQAEHVVASIVNNASFNCVATKMIVTSRTWPQRNEFLNLVEASLQSVPPRFAYYPGAHIRFERATGQASPDRSDGTLPWTLIRDSRIETSPHLFEEESFVCVCAETTLDESSPEAFVDASVEFVNDRLFGTLCATLTLPNNFQRQHRATLDQAIQRLCYGSVCINQWAGVVYGTMTPPWGAYPGATIADPQSGIGSVHNTFRIKNVEKTVLWGPLCNTPKPVWFPSHRTAHQVAWSLMRLYEHPSLTRLPSIFYHALRG